MDKLGVFIIAFLKEFGINAIDAKVLENQTIILFMDEDENFYFALVHKDNQWILKSTVNNKTLLSWKTIDTGIEITNYTAETDISEVFINILRKSSAVLGTFSCHEVDDGVVCCAPLYVRNKTGLLVMTWYDLHQQPVETRLVHKDRKVLRINEFSNDDLLPEYSDDTFKLSYTPEQGDKIVLSFHFKE